MADHSHTSPSFSRKRPSFITPKTPITPPKRDRTLQGPMTRFSSSSRIPFFWNWNWNPGNGLFKFHKFRRLFIGGTVELEPASDIKRSPVCANSKNHIPRVFAIWLTRNPAAERPIKKIPFFAALADDGSGERCGPGGDGARGGVAVGLCGRYEHQRQETNGNTLPRFAGCLARLRTVSGLT